MKLIDGRVERRDLSLTEGIVEGIVDLLCRDPESGCGLPVDYHGRMRRIGLEIRYDIPQLWQALERARENGGPVVELRRILILEGVLILSAGEMRPDLNILDRLRRELHSRNPRHPRVKTRNHLRDAECRSLKGFKSMYMRPLVRW